MQDPSAIQAPTSLEARDGPPLVLVVDDSVDVHRLLSMRLRSEHLRLISAYAGPEAVEMARAERPELVLLDLEMPGMDGFETLRALKDDPDLVSIPVIVLSGLTSPQDKVTAFELGAVDYVTKPFEFVELRVRIRSALRVASLMRLLAQRAQLDGLTGLWNRQFFDERWRGEIAGASRHGRPISLAVIDIDHFKSINDSFGHPAGDQVIQGLAGLLQAQVRASDLACRYGGEEFALIMPETSPSDALALCDRIREVLSTIVWPKHPERRVTCSIGVAGMDNASTADDPSDWVERADRALYEAKTGGRNRVVVSDERPGGIRLRDAG